MRVCSPCSATLWVGPNATAQPVVHHRVLTLDSHCDTPMFFDRDIDLCRRDPQLLVDFVKMREGLLDASIMVAYLPHGELTPEARLAATAKADSPIDELEARVAQAPGVCMAATPAELYAHKQAGLLSIMRGIENGYALGHDPTNVARFRKRGVVYITLCHNGDNDICDSARCSQQLHGGLSDFGREVVREMNRVGLMVDLSHAAESSFYDALRASRTPIVCSHASSRALCNHPRNLTDDQLRAPSRSRRCGASNALPRFPAPRHRPPACHRGRRRGAPHALYRRGRY